MTCEPVCEAKAATPDGSAAPTYTPNATDPEPRLPWPVAVPPAPAAPAGELAGTEVVVVVELGGGVVPAVEGGGLEEAACVVVGVIGADDGAVVVEVGGKREVEVGAGTVTGLWPGW